MTPTRTHQFTDRLRAFVARFFDPADGVSPTGQIIPSVDRAQAVRIAAAGGHPGRWM
ncbi:hypothetical protein NOCA2210022 [metagenome]|uniref:Uncharacterized protein n=1 Tax=metagenome TaxID=256318 RepID=A0A2P2C1R2_9ZZZZ